MLWSSIFNWKISRIRRVEENSPLSTIFTARFTYTYLFIHFIFYFSLFHLLYFSENNIHWLIWYLLYYNYMFPIYTQSHTRINALKTPIFSFYFIIIIIFNIPYLFFIYFISMIKYYYLFYYCWSSWDFIFYILFLVNYS